MIKARELRKKYFNETTGEDFKELQKRAAEEIEQAAKNGEDGVIIRNVPKELKDKLRDWLEEYDYQANTFSETTVFVGWAKEYLDILGV